MKYFMVLYILITGVMLVNGHLGANQTTLDCLDPVWKLEQKGDPLYSNEYIDEIIPNQFN